MRVKKKLEKIIAVIIALAAWQLVCHRLGSSVLLASPVEVAARVFSMMGQADTWKTAALTLGKILSGLGLAIAAGCALSALSARFRAFETLLWPYMAAIKSTPVASFIVLCLIWLSAGRLSTFIAFLMALPVIYQNMLTAFKGVDAAKLQMAKVFRMSPGKRILFIYIPGVKPYILSALSIASGLAWKAGVAAEVIGIPVGSVGERLYEAKLYLDTRDLFAWTVIVVAASILTERIIVYAVKRLYAALESI
ncbi:MAG: ABC transporter permease subunit [Clostridia bacterium]|nr:ABC transporter permease subunit [Clostridia bacterium]